MWSKGRINGYEFWVKHFEEGADYGIDGGRVSKLEIRKGNKTVVNYDRGWDIKPEGNEASAVYVELLSRYN